MDLLSHASSPNTASPTPNSQRTSQTDPASNKTPPASAAYFWFLAGTGSWFAAIGMQGVLFSWLVVGVLNAEAKWVGIAQSAMMIPAILLALPGGAIADRYDQRRILMVLHLIASCISVSLVLLVANNQLSMPLLLAYAIGIGTVQAFVMPARDALLSQVASADMLRSVVGMTMTQWGMQVLGSLVAGTARWIGTVSALGLHTLTLLAGIPLLQKLSVSAKPRPHGSLRWADVVEGVWEVKRSPALSATLLLSVAVGVFFIGPFLVVLPLLVRDVYGGGVGHLALLNMTFPLGTILGSITILWRGGLRHKGKAQLTSLLFGAGFLCTVSFGLPFWGTLLAVGAWGISAAIFINAGRTVYQEQASAANRARVLSVYTIGFMGAAGLFGAPLSGVLVDSVGPLMTCIVASGAMIVVVAYSFVCTAITQVE